MRRGLRAQGAHFARFARVLRMRMRAQKMPVFPINTGFLLPLEIFRKRKENKRKEKKYIYTYSHALARLVEKIIAIANVFPASPVGYT